MVARAWVGWIVLAVGCGRAEPVDRLVPDGRPVAPDRVEPPSPPASIPSPDGWDDAPGSGLVSPRRADRDSRDQIVVP